MIEVAPIVTVDAPGVYHLVVHFQAVVRRAGLEGEGCVWLELVDERDRCDVDRFIRRATRDNEPCLGYFHRIIKLARKTTIELRHDRETVVLKDYLFTLQRIE